MTVLYWMVLCAVVQAALGLPKYEAVDQGTIEMLQEYIRINSTSGGDLSEAVSFLKNAVEGNVNVTTYEFTKGYPIVVFKWQGKDPSLSSVMLNSHMDVVPANHEDGWKYPPFSGTMDENGDIYGRGTQDTKSLSLQHLYAVLQLWNEKSLLRDVYVTIMPDEELGAKNGMQSFIKSQAFKNMNVGVVMDEGVAFPDKMSPVFYQDKVAWQFQVDCYGISAHGSQFPATNVTATGKCNNFINRLFEFRDQQYELYKNFTEFGAEKYTTVNLNKINGGFATNVVPAKVTLVVDIRPATNTDEKALEAQLKQWAAEAGSDVTLTYLSKDKLSPATIINGSNPYWVRFKAASEKINYPILPVVPPGSTDSRFIRNIGIPAFGFSPMANTPTLLHEVNERINADVFLKGIKVMKEIIKALSNTPGNETDNKPFAYVTQMKG